MSSLADAGTAPTFGRMEPRPASRRERLARRDEALRSFRALVDALGTSARRIEKKAGVTNAQLFLLQVLSATGRPVTITELTTMARSGQSAISLLVRRLERAGYVVREADAEDGRVRTVAITPAGMKVARRGPVPPTTRLLQAIDRLGDEDLERLALGLRALADELGIEARHPPFLFEHRARL